MSDVTITVVSLLSFQNLLCGTDMYVCVCALCALLYTLFWIMSLFFSFVLCVYLKILVKLHLILCKDWAHSHVLMKPIIQLVSIDGYLGCYQYLIIASKVTIRLLRCFMTPRCRIHFWKSSCWNKVYVHFKKMIDVGKLPPIHTPNS